MLAADRSYYLCTNVYAPTNYADKQNFIDELQSCAPSEDVPWIILGDFNLTCCLEDKNNSNFCANEAFMFNDTINSLGLIEIPLLGRAFTWSNQRDSPTLVRLDGVFVNNA